MKDLSPSKIRLPNSLLEGVFLGSWHVSSLAQGLWRGGSGLTLSAWTCCGRESAREEPRAGAEHLLGRSLQRSLSGIGAGRPPRKRRLRRVAEPLPAQSSRTCYLGAAASALLVPAGTPPVPPHPPSPCLFIVLVCTGPFRAVWSVRPARPCPRPRGVPSHGAIAAERAGPGGSK